jgi:hypothetical protein
VRGVIEMARVDQLYAGRPLSLAGRGPHPSDQAALSCGKKGHPGPLASDEDARKWLGSEQVSGAVFDQWWTVRALVLEGSDRELLEFLKPVKEKIPRRATVSLMNGYWWQ